MMPPASCAEATHIRAASPPAATIAVTINFFFMFVPRARAGCPMSATLIELAPLSKIAPDGGRHKRYGRTGKGALRRERNCASWRRAASARASAAPGDDRCGPPSCGVTAAAGHGDTCISR